MASAAVSVRAWVGGRLVGGSRTSRALTRGGVKCLRRSIDSFGVRGAKLAARRGHAWAAAAAAGSSNRHQVGRRGGSESCACLEARVGGVGVVVGGSRVCRGPARGGVKCLRWGRDSFDLRAREWWVRGRLGLHVIVVPVAADALSSSFCACASGWAGGGLVPCVQGTH
jgi:hypothetical protein